MRRFVAALVVVVTAMASLRGSAAEPPAPSLFADASAALAATLDLPVQPGTLAARAVNMNVAALDSDAVALPLATGDPLRATVIARSISTDGARIWSGQIDAAPFSTATFVQIGDIVHGSIRTLDDAYAIAPVSGSPLHVVRTLDLTQLGVELPPLEPPASLLDEAPPLDTPLDDGSTFDVLVVYTAAARSAAGGSDAAIRARINLGISETNTGYANSGVIPRLRLVGSEFVSYSETGDLETDLENITGTADGFMDAVHARRNALGADLVKLVVGSTAGGACGVAWLMTTLSGNFAPNAFSVTAYPCISPNYTFGHELGHNLGSNHAPDDVVTTTPLYPYSFGYKHPGNLFRTVMAYDCAVNCPRVLRFSNPGVTYNGLPTGTTAQHNNALSINNARTTVANWRQATDGNTAPTITAISNQTIPANTSTGPLAFTVGDGQTAPAALVVTASSSNPSVVPNTGAGLTLAGSGANRTITATPSAGSIGVSTITLTVSDGALISSSIFQVTVTAVASPPTISAIAAQTMPEDGTLTVPFTVSDPDTPITTLVVQATSSNTTLVAAAGLVPGGSDAARHITITPRANQFGTATITVSVSDGTSTAQRTFTLTVTAVNDAPVISGVPALVSTTVATPVTITVTLTDIDSAPAALSLAAVSGNPLLLPASGISVVPGTASATSRAFLLTLTPASGQSGTATVTLTGSDTMQSRTVTFTLSVTIEPTAPDAPTSTVATVQDSTVRISWTPATLGSEPTSFVVELGTAAGETTLPTRTTPAKITSIDLVLPAGTYFTRVRAVNAVGSSAASPETSFTIIEPSPIPGPPGTFSALTSGRSAIFTWTAPVLGDPPTRYVLEAGRAPGLSDLAVFDTGGIQSSFTVHAVPPGTYWTRVRAANAAGVGEPSQDVSIVMGATGGCVGLPSAPVLLTPVVSDNNVTLSWTAPALGGFPRSYIVSAGSAPGLSNLATIDTGSTGTSFARSAPAGIYYARVAARTDCGVGAASNDVSFTLTAAVPGPPQGLTANVGAGGVVTLNWTAPVSGHPATAFVVEAGSAPGLINLATLPVGSTPVTVTAPPGVYFVRVRGLNANGPGPASNEVEIRVP
ncbi:MAG: hypothetical protein IT178_06050 [Acidobacteria bacterium]|nr:hypothetical protein [Acidobacteriota bacterium]